ncbi:atp4 subunit B of the stator stalk of mitochondrial F1F0 ATP synthase [Didymella heteroderae]|uniref:ATP synthase subunit 4 n=1 Tax=Didymella heteroderae TaxID=1769908 RepID=A0A9P5C120_9PLEO|nr:atp4 subunit B of the stator stalk of mitochondrial F1F0 ATP synthase [Didymella heteroderae]
MASRLARSAVGAARLRPALPLRTVPSLAAQARFASSQEDPKKKAQSIMEAIPVPGNSPLTKAAVLSAGAGLSVAAISNELYVVNEESIVALSLLTIFWAVGKYAGPAWSDYAQQQVDKISGILNSARADHTKAVQQRIENVQDLGGVIDITKTLFEVSKETAKLEAQAYELEQKTAIAHEAKNVLDSWVRYESQVKQRQQKELAESIIAKVEKELENPKTLKAILDQSVADVERIVSQKA